MSMALLDLVGTFAVLYGDAERASVSAHSLEYWRGSGFL